MIIHKFMTPCDKIVQCYPTDTIEKALDITLTNPNVGAVFVLHPSGNKHIPIGIVTKTDLLDAYKKGLSLDSPVQGIMGRMIETISETASLHDAASHFERTQHHHVFVVNADNQFVGVLSVWDVSLEKARDDRAWPWNRYVLCESVFCLLHFLYCILACLYFCDGS